MVLQRATLVHEYLHEFVFDLIVALLDDLVDFTTETHELFSLFGVGLTFTDGPLRLLLELVPEFDQVLAHLLGDLVEHILKLGLRVVSDLALDHQPVQPLDLPYDHFC